MAASENRMFRTDHECPLRKEYEKQGSDPFQRVNWHSTVGLVIQTLVFIGSLLGFVRYLEKRLDMVDQHSRLATMNLIAHMKTDHFAKDKSRIMLHNTCKGAMDVGCHPSVEVTMPSLAVEAPKIEVPKQ